MTVLKRDSERTVVNHDKTASLLAYDEENDRLLNVRGDAHAGALTVIQFGHYQVHRGRMYYAQKSATLNIGNTLTIALTTPDTLVEQHLVIHATVTDAATFTLHKEVTSYSGGTAYTPINLNQRYSNVSSVICKSGYTGANPLTLNGGTIIDTEVANAAKGVIWSRAVGEELVLTRNKIWAFRLTSNSNGNTMALKLVWYEVAPINSEL